MQTESVISEARFCFDRQFKNDNHVLMTPLLLLKVLTFTSSACYYVPTDTDRLSCNMIGW